MKLEIVGLKKTYPNKAIGVDEIDVAVDEGQMAVLLGPSGCGKTTLLRLISGLEIPDAGNIKIDGIEITHWEPKRRDVAMVFQNYALYPHMTIRENLQFGLKSRGILSAKRDEAVKWAADLLGLKDFLDRRPKELSGGQRQRVALGRAIVRHPKLYLFDEPLSNLDAELRMRMRGEILALHRRVNGTSIYVTHDQVEAMSLADIIFVMRQGKIISKGSPKELYESPPDFFTAGFLGFPAMNLIEGRLADPSHFVSMGGLIIPLVKSAAQRPQAPESSAQVVFGIRPEDISVTDNGEITCEIISIENLGRNVQLLVKTSTDDRIKIVAQGVYHVGERISVTLDPLMMYLFNKETEERIV
jgi:multiple sugar transport system ATP-binding protein